MQNNSGINVRGHHVLILPDEIEETTSSGIIVKTGSYGDREQMAQMEGTIVSVGNTAWADQIEPWAEVGERVIFAKYAGKTYTGKDKVEYRIVADLDIVATLDKKE